MHVFDFLEIPGVSQVEKGGGGGALENLFLSFFVCCHRVSSPTGDTDQPKRDFIA